jgi:hypothetical protein
MPAASATTAMPAASAPMPAAATAPTAMSGDCRDVCHNAKRAHRNACRQNAYRSLLHRTSPLKVLKYIGVAARRQPRGASPHTAAE